MTAGAQSDSGRTDIAVVGMSGRFPGAPTIADFWKNLCDGIESRTELSERDLAAAGVPEVVRNDPNYVRAAYCIEDADCFDALFFGYAPREARLMDPQHRVLLECAWHAMEHAGYAGRAALNAGVYVGCSLNTYALSSASLLERFDHDPVLMLMSTDKDFLATRIGYKLDLHGPCITVQTACSTSLVAVHAACQSLLADECDMALAGGVCVKVPLTAGYLHREGGMLSADGHCRPFDAAATGTIFGSGAGVVVLKRYADAEADGDTIHAVIKSSAVNNDGARKSSYTAPSVVGIADVWAQAIDFASIEVESIGYVECHGTGTALGDPIEVHGMTKAFRATSAREGCCAIGSVKSNIGHLESASGIAGLIKVISALRHRYLPPALHFTEANPALSLSGSPFFVNERGREWTCEDGQRRAAVNSLGVGGTNATVILEEAPERTASPSRHNWHVLGVSAKTQEQLKASVRQLTESLARGDIDNIADAAYTLQVGRRHFEQRAVVFADREGAFVNAQSAAGPARSARHGPPPILFVFDECDERVLAASLEAEPDGRSVLQRTRAEVAAELRAFTQRDSADQPHVRAFIVRVALTRLWSQWGVRAAHYLGEPRGALVAAYASGTAARSRAIAALTVPQGETGDSEEYTVLHPAGGTNEIERGVLDRFPRAVFVPIGNDGDIFRSIRRNIEKFTTYGVLEPRRADHDGTGPSELLEQVAALWTLGIDVDVTARYAGEARRHIPLPLTPFLRTRHWW